VKQKNKEQLPKKKKKIVHDKLAHDKKFTTQAKNLVHEKKKTIK
jgi:hypothetical protein